MTRANANIARIMICPFDIQRKTMPAADKAEWLVSLCSIKTGLSGYLDPGDVHFGMTRTEPAYTADTAACPYRQAVFCGNNQIINRKKRIGIIGP